MTAVTLVIVLHADVEYPYSLGDIIYDHRAVGVSVVHGGKRLISFLSGSIPYLKFDGCVIVQGDSLCKESCTYRRLSVIIKLILASSK